MKQPHLPGMGNLPFQTVAFDETQYKVFGIATNMDWEGDKLIDWYHEAVRKIRRGPCRDERRPRGRKAPFGQVPGKCGLVVDHGPCPQSQCGHEGLGPPRLVDSKEDESDPLPPDPSARKGHGTCTRTDRSPFRESSVVRHIALRSSENHGGLLGVGRCEDRSDGGVCLLGVRRTLLQKGGKREGCLCGLMPILSRPQL